MELSQHTSTSIQTFSGQLFDVLNLTPERITIEDIAHGLAFECRFGGQIPKFYSVAQHCYYASLEPGTPEEQMEALLHDASEAYLKDMPKPIKNLLPDYQALEERVTEAINAKFEIPFPFSDRLHEVDRRMFNWEYGAIRLKQYEIDYWTPEFAEEMFLERYKVLEYQLKVRRGLEAYGG